MIVMGLRRILLEPWTRHPNDAGESYLQHLRYAMRVGLNLCRLGVCLLIHSLFPFLFVETASKNLYRIVDEMEDRNQRRRILTEIIK